MLSGEPDVGDLLSVEEAIRILDATAVTPRITEVALAEAQGLRLAEDLHADRDYPPFDKSLMDGFAVRCADVESAPVTLRVIGEIAAGQAPRGIVSPGEAVAVMTGAPIPPGTDGVVPVEDVDAPLNVTAGTPIRVLKASGAHRFVARRGSDTTKGTLVLKAGTMLHAAQIAVAATIGAASVRVFAAPRVAVLATGDEIVPAHEAPGLSQIRNSNNPMLMALLKRMGCRVVDLGIVSDKPDLIRRALSKGLALDALFVTGGMSMGRYDFVPRILRELGVELKITKLRIKPGKPFVFGVTPRGAVRPSETAAGATEDMSYVFGLPGNPVSSFACTLRLASRIIARLGGGQPEERFLSARLLEELPPNGPREFYLPARMEHGAEGPRVTALAYKGSADLFTLAKANGLIVRGENEAALGVGAMVRVMEI